MLGWTAVVRGVPYIVWVEAQEHYFYGVKETLQESLVTANDEKFRWHDLVQERDRQIVDLTLQLKRAAARKANVDIVHRTRRGKHDELLTYCNRLTEQGARNALLPDIERLAGELNA